ncbi:hypothetical protein HDV01_007522 [Terramyces sp. JEL0728]|nr:hypothetical protein HDV01_007522 [Terramyces sp. JEL0728]
MDDERRMHTEEKRISFLGRNKSLVDLPRKAQEIPTEVQWIPYSAEPTWRAKRSLFVVNSDPVERIPLLKTFSFEDLKSNPLPDLQFINEEPPKPDTESAEYIMISTNLNSLQAQEILKSYAISSALSPYQLSSPPLSAYSHPSPVSSIQLDADFVVRKKSLKHDEVTLNEAEKVENFLELTRSLSNEPIQRKQSPISRSRTLGIPKKQRSGSVDTPEFLTQKRNNSYLSLLSLGSNKSQREPKPFDPVVYAYKNFQKQESPKKAEPSRMKTLINKTRSSMDISFMRPSSPEPKPRKFFEEPAPPTTPPEEQRSFWNMAPKHKSKLDRVRSFVNVHRVVRAFSRKNSIPENEDPKKVVFY